LLVYHPQSPFKGAKYAEPVELLDIYPTLIDLAGIKPRTQLDCIESLTCKILSGQTLAPVILGEGYQSRSVGDAFRGDMTVLKKTYAVSQVIRCCQRGNFERINDPNTSPQDKRWLGSKMWDVCSSEHRDGEITLMGYSMRVLDYRYTAYIPFDRRTNRAIYNVTSPVQPMFEELYDHRNDHQISIVNREMVNVARRAKSKGVVRKLRSRMTLFLNSISWSTRKFFR
jgi:hypothetical protein